MEELDQVGPRLRAARHAQGWTLEDLALRANVSASTLSRLESGKRQASLELLLPLTRQLGIRVDDLLPAPVRDPRIRRPLFHSDGHVFEPLAPEGAVNSTYRITYQPSQGEPELKVHPGFEWLYVLRGKLQLTLGEQQIVLSPGEAAQFDTLVPHAMAAAGARPAQVLSIFNAEGERLHTHTGGEAVPVGS